MQVCIFLAAAERPTSQARSYRAATSLLALVVLSVCAHARRRTQIFFLRPHVISRETWELLRRPQSSTLPYACRHAGAYRKIRPLSIQAVCVLGRRRTHAIPRTDGHVSSCGKPSFGSVYSTSPPRHFLVAVTIIASSFSEALCRLLQPGAYLREATVTGAFKRTC